MKARASLGLALLGAMMNLSACSGCSGGHGQAPTGDAGAAAASSSPASGSWLSRRDPGPSSGSPQEALYPTPSREPDWDLDTADAARDYVRRYAFFTKRYGENLDCVDLGASQPAGDKRRVEVKTAPSCPGAGTVRDVFMVDVAGDRLGVDDPAKRDPLARWPDGSSPDGPSTEKVREIVDMKNWQSPVRAVFGHQSLVPVRVQAYGRGTYPVVSIAGWHGPLQRNASPDAFKPLAEELCRTTGGMPLGIFAAMDRVHLLRVRCPAATRFDTL